MNATLLEVEEDYKSGNYEDPAPMMMADTTEENKENEAFILSPQLVDHIATSLKAAGWKPEE